jgi:hypothetical protein
VTRIVLAIVVVFAVASCASPAQLYKMNAWLATHTTVQHVDVFGRSCGQLVNNTIIQLDPGCEQIPWYYWHEVGHAVDVQVFGRMRGPNNTVGNEQTAQCVAEVVLGYSPGYAPEDVANGYWDCPDYDVDHTRAVMEAAGIW